VGTNVLNRVCWFLSFLGRIGLIRNREQVYFKNIEMREMDDHFGDVYGIISDREIEISHELAQHVLEYQDLLTTVSDICGELDRLGLLSLKSSRVALTSVAYLL
jgi:DNA mismatch repair ATPase MutS